MTNYPISDQLRTAIESLFEDPSIAFGLLGQGVEWLPDTDREESYSPNAAPSERAKRLRKSLESYVRQMATEVAELGPDELPRLRAETTATLVVLRELHRHFPEAFE